MSEKRIGRVKWFNTDKGYGFIAVTGEDDVFVHASDLKKSGIREPLVEGEELAFEMVPGRNGVKATAIARIPKGTAIPIMPASLAARNTVISAQRGDA